MNHALQTFVDALSLGSLYALAALGIGLLFGILRIANFAHGDFISVCAYTLVYPFTGSDTSQPMVAALPAPLVIMIVMLTGAILANLVDWSVFRGLRRASAPTLMIASFAIGFVIRNALIGAYGARPRTVNIWPALARQVTFDIGAATLRMPLVQIASIAATALVLICVSGFLRFTPFGIQMRAAAEDFRMAIRTGIRSRAEQHC